MKRVKMTFLGWKQIEKIRFLRQNMRKKKNPDDVYFEQTFFNIFRFIDFRYKSERLETKSALLVHTLLLWKPQKTKTRKIFPLGFSGLEGASSKFIHVLGT
jgi:hypothetical protein